MGKPRSGPLYQLFPTVGHVALLMACTRKGLRETRTYTAPWPSRTYSLRMNLMPQGHASLGALELFYAFFIPLSNSLSLPFWNISFKREGPFKLSSSSYQKSNQSNQRVWFPHPIRESWKGEEIPLLEGWWLRFKAMEFLKTFHRHRAFLLPSLREVLASSTNIISWGFRSKKLPWRC